MDDDTGEWIVIIGKSRFHKIFEQCNYFKIAGRRPIQILLHIKINSNVTFNLLANLKFDRIIFRFCFGVVGCELFCQFEFVRSWPASWHKCDKSGVIRVDGGSLGCDLFRQNRIIVGDVLNVNNYSPERDMKCKGVNRVVGALWNVKICFQSTFTVERYQ